MPEEFFHAMYCENPNAPWGPSAQRGGEAPASCQCADAPESSGGGSERVVGRRLRPRRDMRSALVVAVFGAVALGCPVPPESNSLCASLAPRCGGVSHTAWEAWCNSACVPEFASQTPCAANEDCLLCDAPDASGRVAYFGLPGNDLEYLWTFADDEAEPTHPDVLPAPTGSSFEDRADSWSRSASSVGAWQILQPYDVEFGQPAAFCEPGPNQYLGANIASFADSVVLRAQRLDATHAAQRCSSDTCPSGPYPACGTPFVTECPYGDAEL